MTESGKAPIPSDRQSPAETGSPDPARAGVLRRELWPRTLRTALVSALLPWARARSRRGKIDAEIATYRLPPPLAGMISKTVHATRLWPEERLDVAREVCAHFTDGIEAGRPAEQLIADFGDPKKAAGLIRSAKVRCRPMWWKTFRWFARSTAALVILALVAYGWLFARFYWSAPTIRHNYTAEINAPLLAIPREERAWPMYVQAILESGPQPEFVRRSDWPSSPRDAHWAEGMAYLKSHERALGLIRKAAGMKHLGYVYAENADPEYSKALEVRSPGYKYQPELETHSENPAMIGILLPYLGEMRSYARLLRFDATVAAQERDTARFVADIEALIGITDQCSRSGFFIDTLVAVAIGDLTANVILEHASEPGLLGEKDFKTLAHRFGQLGDGRISFHAEFERLSFEDLLQRFFTDDGKGDGHMIGAHMREFYSNFGVQDPMGRFVFRTIQPVRVAVVPSRAALRAKIDSFIASLHRDEALPPWRADERSDGHEQAEVYAALDHIFPFSSLAGDAEHGFSKQIAQRDLFETKRSVVLTVLALESFKHTNGMYPPTLDALVPAYLPQAPLDPFTGKPMRYVLSGDGSAQQVLLYSVGVDMQDDGGRPPADAKDRPQVTETNRLAWFKAARPPKPSDQKLMDRSRGDWVIYPPLPPIPKTEAEK